MKALRVNLKRRGFTLLELLVVTVIIGMLSAMMVPALSHARQRAKRVACGETLHGLAIGMKVYLSQWNEIYPASAQMPSVNLDNEPLPVTLKDEVTGGAGRAFKCVADESGYVRSSDSQPFDSYFAGETLSYDYNMGLGGRRIQNAFLYSMFHEAAIYVLQDFDTFHDERTHAVTCKNLLFADGHVGSVEDISAALGVARNDPGH